MHGVQGVTLFFSLMTVRCGIFVLMMGTVSCLFLFLFFDFVIMMVLRGVAFYQDSSMRFLWPSLASYFISYDYLVQRRVWYPSSGSPRPRAGWHIDLMVTPFLLGQSGAHLVWSIPLCHGGSQKVNYPNEPRYRGCQFPGMNLA